jgi:hypothetical protein
MVNEKEDRILLYLRESLAKGKEYFKSKYIAKEVGLSPKQVGTTLFRLSKQRDVHGIEIVAWSESLSTTWRIKTV